MVIAKVTINDLIKYREEIEQLTEVLNEAQNGIERLAIFKKRSGNMRKLPINAMGSFRN